MISRLIRRILYGADIKAVVRGSWVVERGSLFVGRGSIYESLPFSYDASLGHRHLPGPKINRQVLATKKIETQETINACARR